MIRTFMMMILLFTMMVHTFTMMIRMFMMIIRTFMMMVRTFTMMVRTFMMIIRTFTMMIHTFMMMIRTFMMMIRTFMMIILSFMLIILSVLRSILNMRSSQIIRLLPKMIFLARSFSVPCKEYQLFIDLLRMSARKLVILLLSFFLLTNSCAAQKILALDNYRLIGFKRIRFKEGDIINFRLNDLKQKYTGEILHITDSTIILKGMDVPVNTIGMVYRGRGNFLTKSFAKAFIWAGLGFIILDTGNNLITHSSTIIDERAVIAGSSLMLVGGIMKLVEIKKYKIGNKHTLKIIDVTP